MLNHEDASDAHHGASVIRHPAKTDSTPSLIQAEPRYIQFPDVLYSLRHRYPTVTESIFLECTRCHQWVAVPVLSHIPDEVREGHVAQSAQGLDSIHVRTSWRGPLRHISQDSMRRHEELSVEASNIQWRSPRLLERETQQRKNSSKDIKDSSGSHGVFAHMLQQLSPNGRRSITASHASTSTAQPRRHPLLFIPNPDTFVCAGWQCAWDTDVLADLRREWMASIYKALPMPAMTDEALTPSSSTVGSSTLSFFPATPALSSTEVRAQRKAALNEALSDELGIHRSRRHSRGYGARLSRPGDLESESSTLSPLSLPTQPLSANHQAKSTSSAPTAATETTATTPSNSSTNKNAAADGERQLSRMQQSWVKAAALHLLRNGNGGEEAEDKVEEVGGAARARCPYFSSSSPPAPTEENNGPLLSAYCWAVCDACGKLRRVAQPFPGGAPFVCAMAVTTSSSCRAARDGGATTSAVDNACSVSEVEGFIQCGIKLCEGELIAAALSSPFLPYPLKSQLTSLSVLDGEGSHSVKDVAVDMNNRLSRADVVRVLLAEPLLRTIHDSVMEAVADGTKSPATQSRRTPNSKCRRSATTPVATPVGTSQKSREGKNVHHKENAADDDDDHDSNGGDATACFFLQRSLPILRELARTIKKRGVASLVRQIQLTPAQIQAKREAVLRSSFLESYQGGDKGSSAMTGGAVSVEAEKQKEEIIKPDEEKEAKEEAAEDASTTPAVAATAPVTSKATRGGRRLGGRPPVQEKRKRSRPSADHHLTTPGVENDAEVSKEKSGTATRRLEEDGQVATEGNRRGRVDGSAETTVKKARKPQVKVEVEQTQPQRRMGRPRGRPRLTEKEPTEKEDTAKKEAKKKTSKQQNAETQKGAVPWEVVHWVLCDRCSKWRIVPHRVSSRLKFWECKMRYDEARGRATTCDDPDEADQAT